MRVERTVALPLPPRCCRLTTRPAPGVARPVTVTGAPGWTPLAESLADTRGALVAEAGAAGSPTSSAALRTATAGTAGMALAVGHGFSSGGVHGTSLSVSAAPDDVRQMA